MYFYRDPLRGSRARVRSEIYNKNINGGRFSRALSAAGPAAKKYIDGHSGPGPRVGFSRKIKIKLYIYTRKSSPRSADPRPVTYRSIMDRERVAFPQIVVVVGRRIIRPRIRFSFSRGGKKKNKISLSV